ncbi:fatty-acid amide hydrolase 2-like [Eriocheir sinensis]|uniref:fatty-acid amide hydrolase 2-like n=1 Tax=Eriocheir sinensis TaxID=95602 RepID=UPI0021CA5F65|nr:fatty-acid amide hydrolase 2-like [Eriocheir sinensis]
MIYRLLRDIYSFLVYTFLRLLWAFTPRTRVPPITDAALTQSPATLARWIRENKRSSESIVGAFVARIKAVNPILNGVVMDRFDEALKEARDTDEWLKTLTKEEREKVAETKPVLGVPFTVKENVMVKGMSHTHALRVRQGKRAPEDAQVIALLRNAGGIPLCVTNIPELGLSYACANVMYGTTNNPYDISRTPGGSSGGESALLASCGTPMAFGTDLGGSIRCPAAYTCTFGHKPTSGWVPLGGTGLFPSKLRTQRVMVCGPLTRYANDLPFVMEIIAPLHAKGLTQKVQNVDLTELKVWWSEGVEGCALISSTDKILVNAVHHVTRHMAETFRVPTAKWPFPMSDAMEVTGNKMSEDFLGEPPVTEDLADRKGRISLRKEWLKMLSGFGNFTANTLALATATTILVGAKEPKKSPYYWKNVQKKFLDVLGDKGVLVMPVMPTVPPFHLGALFNPMDLAYTSIFNGTELPGTTAPLGLSKDGLPVAVQVISAPGNDHLTIAVARALEEKFGGWVPPCPLQI